MLLTAVVAFPLVEINPALSNCFVDAKGKFFSVRGGKLITVYGTDYGYEHDGLPAGHYVRLNGKEYSALELQKLAKDHPHFATETTNTAFFPR